MHSLIVIVFCFFALAPMVLAAPLHSGSESGTVSPTCTQRSDGTFDCTQSQPNTSQIQSQPNTIGNNVTLVNPLGSGATLNSLVTSVLQFVVRIGAIIVVFMLIYVGYLFVVAQGNETKITEARKALQWTVIGALILLGAQAIATGIQATVQALSTGG